MPRALRRRNRNPGLNTGQSAPCVCPGSLSVFVNIVVVSLHAHCFSSSGCMRSGLSQTSSFNFQLRVDLDQRRGLRCLASA